MSYDLDVIIEARRGGEQMHRTFPCFTKGQIWAAVSEHVLKRKDVIWWEVATDIEKAERRAELDGE